MIRWHTEKRWIRGGRNCEIHRTTVGGATQYRGLVELDTDVPDRALDAYPGGQVHRKRRPMSRGRDGYRTWLFLGWSGEEVGRLREAVDDLADYADETEI